MFIEGWNVLNGRTHAHHGGSTGFNTQHCHKRYEVKARVATASLHPQLLGGGQWMSTNPYPASATE